MRQRFTKSEVEQLERQIYDYVEGTRPVSVRHVYYRMTDPGLPVHVEKTESGYKKIQNRMREMRVNGTLPFAWISDMTRRGYFTDTWSSKEEFLKQTASLYRRSVWADYCYDYVEVWCESRSMVGPLWQTCSDLAVPLYPTGGFPSLSLIYEASEAIKSQIEAFGYNNIIILYIGDYDPSGLTIDVDLENKMRGFIGDVGIEFKRIGITEEQIVQYALPTKPRKPTDKLRPDILKTVETEALDASILRGLLRGEIESHIPEGTLRVLHETEKSERVDLLSLAKSFIGQG